MIGNRDVQRQAQSFRPLTTDAPESLFLTSGAGPFRDGVLGNPEARGVVNLSGRVCVQTLNLFIAAYEV